MLRRFLLLLLFTPVAMASPWFTGPLLAPAGKTIPAGHVNFEPYGFYTTYPDHFRNIETVPVVTIGLANFMDIQMSLPLDYSWDRAKHGAGMGDYSLGLGFQILRQKEHSWMPDLRFVIQEVFPTGRFENLDPTLLGTDQTGIGAYQTFFGLNFQYLTTLPRDQYLRSRLSFSADVPSDVTVNGPNVFGGGANASGRVHLNNSYAVDLAFEYALTQHWVPVFEVLYANSGNTIFEGNPGFTPGGTIASVGGPGGNSASFAPALEYNFTGNLGLIAGIWFSATGPHAATFTSTVLALNCYF